ncbi:tRNA (adenosine(37)-N6)-threonylcarbamoyltransferase complex dimerization subunit type 1 TsaB [Nostocoides sp. HKS02]|uniref:tRNA (adenosine(37)-N6)-threonylcarbamoyltransferase complex dimerization subunit type 1 TsaB n=1 Tax=Nostocoides sp. HKS02 TaxID=1813880 RepID=UPI001E56431D|nr:tRNA (adenosine(37)-N6)-threonylcarbamoyltransferase complex dimerization subunit type 1 TsaB [Tetrasphaera sp. HKS02]
MLDARGHTEHLAPLVTEVLESAERSPADVTDVAVGTGPGPFTGLRVGMVTALVFGHARGVPVHGVCSLDALAYDAAALVGEGEFLVATDARRKEVYWARYAARNGAAQRLTEPAVDRPADLPEHVRAVPTAGRGPLLFPELFRSVVPVHDVQATSLAALAAQRLAAGVAMPVEPLYLRRPDALTTAERARS